MSGKQQKSQCKQLQLAFSAEVKGETPSPAGEGTEPLMADRTPENPAVEEPLMEVGCARNNLIKAWKRVRANKGSAGVDGRTIEQTANYLRDHWPTIRDQLLSGAYQPQPVRRVEIPKSDGGVRKLGIPCAIDRLIQQAVLQVLQRRWDPTFSENSYGFRPGRSAHQAVAQAQTYVAEGYVWCVDIDLEKFFDRVNHDIMMDRVAKRVSDKRLLKLIRAFLNAGVMENGLVSATEEGTPQGGPLSPLLSNLLLDDLDRELTRRGHRFCRYADDCNVYVRSQRAGERVMESICKLLAKRLKLKVNESKSAVARTGERQFLGFTISNDKEPIRDLTWRTLSISQEQMAARLARYINGWKAYTGFARPPWCYTTWRRGFADAFGWSYGDNGAVARTDTGTCAVLGYLMITRLLLLGPIRGIGVCPGT